MAMDEQEQKVRCTTTFSEILDKALYCILNRCIDDPCDRASISLVSRQWHRIDSDTRKRVTVAFCYSAVPDMLRTRFPRLESLKIKGRPRASMFGRMPEGWGGYARPWIQRMSNSNGFDCLKELHLRRMVVTDDDLGMLVVARGHALQSLRLDRCDGFSTDGLRIIAASCRCLQTLCMEHCNIVDKGREWLRDLASYNNGVLLHLSFYMTGLRVSAEDLELLARNCRSLISLKISECDLVALPNFFKLASKLEEFWGGSFDANPGEARADAYDKVVFPPGLLSVGLLCMGPNEVSVVYPLSASLTELDLLYTFLGTEDQCQLIQKCPNLEVLNARTVIGDRGLQVLSNTCKRLRRLRILTAADLDRGQQNEQARVTQVGLISVAVGCRVLQYLAVYVFDVSNAALEAFGKFCSNLQDFRLALLDNKENVSDLPLDNGVRALLQGCAKLDRFSFSLRSGGLSDVGLGYIGEYSGNVRCMLLGNVGESDLGLMDFARGCKNLVKLELRDFCFSERALALAILQLPSLRYVYAGEYNASLNGEGFREMSRRYWNMEFIPPRTDEYGEASEEGSSGLASKAQLLAYYSLAGPRMDLPDYAVPLFLA